MRKTKEALLSFVNAVSGKQDILFIYTLKGIFL